MLKECGQAVGDGCIVCCGISGGEVGGQDAQQVVGRRGCARLCNSQAACKSSRLGRRWRSLSWSSRLRSRCLATKASCPRGEFPSTVIPWHSGGRDQSPTQTGSAPSSPLRSAMLLGSSPAEFQIRVLPSWRRIRALCHRAAARAS